jgi:hypothetical protein
VSTEFWQFFAPFALAFLVAGAVVGAFLTIRGTASGGYVGAESSAMWVKPVVILGAAAGLWGDIGSNVDLWLVFALAFVGGLACGLTAVPPLLFGRDLVLGIISLLAAAVILFLRLSSGSDMLVVYLLYLAAFAAGIAFGGVKRLLQPVTGIAILAGLEMIDFLLSPFGPTQFPGAQVPVMVVGVIAALGLGALIRVSPDFVVLLGGLSVTLLGVVLQVFLWFETSNNLGSGIVPDWTVGVAWLGIALGYGLIRAPFAMIKVKRLF